MTARHSQTRGTTLVELIVSMALGLVLMLAVATLHARILFMSAGTTRAADAQDTLRIALAMLEYELQHAGYWGLVPDASTISGRRGDAAPLAVIVAGDCGPDWTTDLERPVEAWADGWPLDCAPFGGAASPGGVLALRRADTRVSSPEAQVLQVHANPWTGRLAVDGEPPDPGAEARNLVARAYYVSPRSTGDPLRPSLRRKTLQRGPRIIDEEIVPGVAGMRIELGVDTDLEGTPGHGQPNRFVTPGAAAGEIRAVRVTLWTDDDARLAATRTIALRNGPAP
ncbi:MAG: PilW family protein [Gammaproteobacteria bacterium]